MQKQRTPEIDQLYKDVLAYRSTKDFKSLLSFVSKFRHIAPYNAMLIHIQKPGSSYVASAADWKYRFERNVKPGARPLVILKPFGPVSFVFEYNDTEGKPLPDDLVRPFITKEVANPRLLSIIKNGAACDGIEVCEQQYGTSRAGQIEYTGHEKLLSIKTNSKEVQVRSHYAIVLNSNLSSSEQFTTMLHELGHFYCGHLNDGKDKWLPTRPYLDVDQIEFEAETVCWIVCERLGIESPSVEYLSGYLDEEQFIPDVSVDAIMKAAGMVEAVLNGTAKPRKDLIVKNNESEQLSMFSV